MYTVLKTNTQQNLTVGKRAESDYVMIQIYQLAKTEKILT